MKPGTARVIHFISAVIFTIYAMQCMEWGRSPWLFLVAAVIALTAGVSASQFIRNRWVMLTLVWCEAIITFFIAFRFFAAGYRIMPWAFLITGFIFGLNGYRLLGGQKSKT